MSCGGRRRRLDKTNRVGFTSVVSIIKTNRIVGFICTCTISAPTPDHNWLLLLFNVDRIRSFQ